MLHKDLVHENVVKFELFFEDGINAYIILENCPNQVIKLEASCIINLLKNFIHMYTDRSI